MQEVRLPAGCALVEISLNFMRGKLLLFKVKVEAIIGLMVSSLYGVSMTCESLRSSSSIYLASMRSCLLWTQFKDVVVGEIFRIDVIEFQNVTMTVERSHGNASSLRT